MSARSGRLLHLLRSGWSRLRGAARAGGDRTREPVPTDSGDRQQEPPRTVNRESHPNAGGPQGLAGDMGLSSERHGPFDGIEGTGSQASAAGSTEGESPTAVPRPDGQRLPEEVPAVEGQPAPDKPDRTSPATGVDRTVGEVQPDPVEHHHPFDPDKNPRH